ncbi:iron uptake porin [Leptolyngbya sp. PCC 6406]|uniref:iron uptake porin n=1 Tax=Leptolyngbya sp. PCC 6406 TaxID=1173264 RepID=UPI0002ACD5F2|nr:iron uptake porin [Leptolyngbya sp. PCC 6406]
MNFQYRWTVLATLAAVNAIGLPAWAQDSETSVTNSANPSQALIPVETDQATETVPPAPEATEAEGTGDAIVRDLPKGAITDSDPAPDSVSVANAQPSDPNSLLEFEPLADADLGGQPSLPDTDQLAQTPSVVGLSDVQPTDWAFQALRNLIDNYGCLSGFPDGTFRGDRPVSRFEFAAGLSACLDVITSVNVSPNDIGTISRLQREFAAELTTSVEALEARVEELRGNQFSSNTRLFGQVIFGLQARSVNRADFFPVDGVAETNDPGGGLTTFYSNAQLSFLTQLSPRSLLLFGLQSGSGNSLFDTASNSVLGLTNNIRLAYESDTNFSVRLSDLTYRHLVGDNLALIVGASGVDPVGVFRGPNRYESAGQGPLSLFAQRNPVTSVGNGRSGVGFDWQISDRLSLQGVYSLADRRNPNGPGPISPLANDYVLGFQLTSAPNDSLNLALNYLHSYSSIGSLGTGIGDDQLTIGDQITGLGTPAKTNAFGATVTWDVNPRLTLGTWGGYTISAIPGESGNVNTVNWMLFANFPDLFRPGNLGGIYIGQPPRIVSSNLRQGQNVPNALAGGLGDPGGQPGRTIHLEAFYRHQISDSISITPGFIVIFNPANTPGSDTIGIGALRTTFTF